MNHKILKIKRSKRYSDRIIIILDNKSVFRIPEDAFILNPLHVGDEISSKDIKKFDKKMRFKEAKDSAYRLLSYRMRSISEVKKRLKDKSFSSDEIESTIDHLINLNYLNDQEFCRAFSSEKVKLKKIGPFLLKSDLFKHGLDSELIDNCINEIYNQYNIQDLIEFHLEKKKIIKNELLDKKDKKRLDNYLIRKGFSWELINNAYAEWGLI